jgi:3-deoxy-manno-octulosonate cytidylyltransferase (CMP-KDO synthetase)
MPASAIIAIPARLASQRLPNKMLLAETGKPLIEHTWSNATRATRATEVVVVTDTEAIAHTVTGFGGHAVLTSPEASSGTARIVEALPQLPAADIIVNLQGDEPELPPDAIDMAISLLDRCPAAGVATLVTPLRSETALHDSSVVKALLTPWRESPQTPQHAVDAGPSAWRAITFSRAPVPAARDWNPNLLRATPPLFWQHIGVYAYRRNLLERWNTLPASRLADLESLEQLRLVEAAVPIVAAAITDAAVGIDTPADYAAFVQRMQG